MKDIIEVERKKTGGLYTVKNKKNPLYSLSCEKATEILEDVANGAYGYEESKEIEMIKERRLGAIFSS